MLGKAYYSVRVAKKANSIIVDVITQGNLGSPKIYPNHNRFEMTPEQFEDFKDKLNSASVVVGENKGEGMKNKELATKLIEGGGTGDFIKLTDRKAYDRRCRRRW